MTQRTLMWEVDSDQIIRQVNRIAPWIPYKNADGTYGTIGDGNQ